MPPIGDIGSGPLEDRAVGLTDRQCAIVGEVEPPTTFVDDVVMSCTQRDEIRQIGRPARLPRHDVVHLAPVEDDVTRTERTAAVQRSKGPAL